MMKNRLYNPFMLFMTLPMCFETPGEGAGSAVSNAGAGEGETSPSESEAAVDEEGKSKEGEGEGEAKSKEGEGTAPEPITMEALTLPEGFEIAEENQADVLALLNDPELSRTDLFNKLVEMQSAVSVTNAKTLQNAMTEQWTNTQTEWRKELAAHPEIGGERLDESLAEVKIGLEAAGADKEVFDALDITGAGNHPALVALLHKLTGPYREAAPVTTAPGHEKLPRDQRMFPNMAKG